MISEEGRISCFIGRSVDTTIRNLIDNPVNKEGVKEKMSKTKIESDKIRGKNNYFYGKHHTEESKLKIRMSKWKPSSNHKTFYIGIARQTMEKSLQRKLLSTETIHHLDGDRTNNDINNLYLFNSNKKHTTYHCFLRDLVKTYLLTKQEANKYNMKCVNKRWLN